MSAPKFSIVFVTGRRDPKFSWFCDSLCAQTTEKQRAQVEVIFIDGHAWGRVDPMAAKHAGALYYNKEICEGLPRGQELKQIAAGRFEYLHLPPKPSAYQGPFRQTSRDFFAAGVSRNSAVIVARSNYLVYCDDLAVLGPQWFDQAVHAAENQYVCCGMYAKHRKMVVENGRIVSSEPFHGGVDSRTAHGSPNGIVPWHGSGMFGCSFGVPLEAMLEVDGNDGACITQGGEDYDLGIRLERAGWAFYLNQNLFTTESDEDHHVDNPLPRIRRMVTPDRLPANYEGQAWSDHVVLNRLLRETDRVLPLIGDNLRELRARYQMTGLVPVPAPGQVDWRDGQNLSEL